ncbi:MAG: ABC transporter substrate-binding protein [Treponema sp.]|nr:ABC transporter substrate-binding protein [Treponema sp.]
MKRIMLLLAVFAIAGSVVFAGGNSQTTQTAAAAPGTSVVRWSFWGAESRLKAVQQAIDVFTERTGIVVAGEPAPGTNEHFDKFRTQFAGGMAVDIVQVGGDFSNFGISDQINKAPGIEDLLLPLDSYVKSGVLDISKVDAAAVQAGTRSGILYALPVATNMPALMYNKSLLERVGAPMPNVSMTWAEFDAWLRQVQAKLPAGVYAMTDNGATVTGSVFFGYWCGDNGTDMWDGTQTHLTAADVQKYFDMWAKWRNDGLIPPAGVAADYAETSEATSSLIAGKTAVMQTWSNQITGYSNATPDDLELIELPNAAVGNRLWGQMSQMMAINKNSKNPQAAVQFLSYYINDPVVWGFLGTSYGIPVTPAGRAAILANADDSTKKQAGYLDVAGKHAGPRNPNMPSDTEWNAGLFLIYQNVAYGKITSAQGAQQVMDLINRLTK